MFTRAVLITGGTSGLGYHAALAIARQCPDHCIIIASRRDPNKSADQINRKLNQENVQFLHLDLGDLKNVRSFVRAWGEKQFPPISMLLLNAGLQYPGGVKYTVDGIEAAFGVNHVGHALLFSLLQPHMANEARIVVTSSGTHDPSMKTGVPDAKYTTAEELAHPTAATLKNPGRQRYATSKLCNVMWTYALHRRLQLALPTKKWTVVAFDPGLMPGTGLAREAGPVLRFLWKRVLPPLIPLLRRLVSHNIHPPEKSGENLAWIAIEGKDSGVYYEMRKPIKSSIDSYDETKQEELWSWTIKTLAVDDNESREFQIVH